ncbi:MAG: glycosyltransferase family 4 protein [Candidatus Magasanikbacteria bacterium]|nr:glycosyltransferase family 4 protein [Candidatus Magasanikbacteria bacterium]
MILGIDASRANRDQKTGVEWYAFFIIQELKKIVPSDWEVRLYTDRPLQGELATLPENWTQKVLNWPPKRLWTQVRLSLEMIQRTPDVLFVPAHVQPYIHPKKTVLTVHDVAAKSTPGAYNRFEKWYSLWTAEEALQKLPAVIVPTLAVKNDLLRLFPKVNGEHIHVVHHGINPIFLTESGFNANTEVLNKNSIQKPFIIAVGRIEHKKNSVGLVEAFGKAVEMGYKGGLVLVGKPGFGYHEVEHAVKKSLVKNYIRIIPWLETGDLVGLMRQADALAFPSLAEGFGLPILEAMALGLPVIASDIPVLREVGGSAAKYVAPYDTEQLAKAIIEVSQPVNQARYRLLGRERAQNFSWKNSAAKTLEIITVCNQK